jgi:deoxyribonuclease-4
VDLLRLGAHMSVSGGKHMALERGKELGCEAVQVFIRNVRGWASKPLEQKEIDEFLETKVKLQEEIWPLLSHNSYLINLATSDQEKLTKSYTAMLDELNKAEQLKLDYIVIHPGTYIRIAEQLNSLIQDTDKSKVKILLETVAGQGHNLGRKFHHLKFIIDRINDKDRIGVCFDTCHSFTSGYDFTTKKKYIEVWNEFDDVIGLDYLFAFHLNDSEKGLGSRVDRHTHIGQGKIGKEAFGFLINDERFKEHPGILETPKGKDMKEDVMNLSTLKSLIKK